MPRPSTTIWLEFVAFTDKDREEIEALLPTYNAMLKRMGCSPKDLFWNDATGYVCFGDYTGFLELDRSEPGILLRAEGIALPDDE